MTGHEPTREPLRRKAPEYARSLQNNEITASLVQRSGNQR